jgi:hypothetical protein
MKKLYLILFLGIGIFSQQGWAPPIKGGATGGAEAAPDISKCDLNPSKQTKVTLTTKSGKVHRICTGVAICAGKSVPVSCKVSERELCPIAKQCLVFNSDKNDPVVKLLYDLERNQKLTYSVYLDTTKVQNEPESEKLAFALEIKKDGRTIYTEPKLRWKQKKIYQIQNKEITDRLEVGTQLVKMWNFISSAQWGLIDHIFELNIDGNTIVRKNFSITYPKPPSKPDLPDPFPPLKEEDWLPRDTTGPNQQLPPPIAITGTPVDVYIKKN